VSFATSARLGCHVDNLPAPALLDHYLRGSLAAPEQPLAVNVEYKIPVLLGRFEKWDDLADARIVHQDIQAAKPIDRRIYHCLDLLLVTHVYCYRHRFAVAACDLIDNLLSVCLLEVTDHHRSAFLSIA
jgi:hypothetical protein